ncbi:MAG: flagellar assembly peptidoglycan hydrolase FlgJ [Pseudomonadota bacterium]
MDGVNPLASNSANLAYTDYTKLQNKFAGAENNVANITKAAKHFESVFIDMWLKSAREANKVMAEGNFMSGAYMEMSQQMLDHEMAVHLSDNGGVGLADVIVRQMSPYIVDSGEHQAMPPETTPKSNSLTEVAEIDRHHFPRGVTQLAQMEAANLETPTAVGQKTSLFTDPDSFVAEILPVIRRTLAGSGLPVLAVLGQAALETGWGSQIIADVQGTPSHNLFGIKAPAGEERAVSVPTREYEHGRWLDKVDRFKAYGSWDASVQDYLEKITSQPRYAPVRETDDDVAAYAQALQRAGYATDPNYARKIIDVVESISNMLGE